MSFLTRITLKFWPLILISILTLSVLSIPRTINLFKGISTDPADLLPGDHPNVKTLFRARGKTEKTTKLSIVFESQDPASTRRFMDETAEKLREHPLVGSVTNRKQGHTFFDDHKLLYVEMEDLKTVRDRLARRIQNEKLGGLYIDFSDEDEFSFQDLKEKYLGNTSEEATDNLYYVSKDGKVYNMFVEMKSRSSSLSDATVFQDAMQKFVEELKPETYHPTAKVYFSGASKVIEYRSLMNDLKRVGMISGILLFIPLLLRFRNPIHVGAIFLPLLVGMPLSFALSSFFVSKLTISTSFLFAILGGLGIESGIHIFTRYHEGKQEGKSLPLILDEVFGHVGRAMLTAVASVAVTFLLLLMVDFRGFSEFGLISGLGLWVLFFVYFTFFPSLLVLLEKIKLLRVRQTDHARHFTFRLPQKAYGPLLIIFIAFTVFSLAVTPFLEFEFDSKKIRADIPEVKLAREKQRLTVRGTNNPAVIVLDSKEEALALKAAVTERMKNDKTPTIENSHTYYDLIPDRQDEKMTVVADIKKLLDDPAMRLVKGESKKDLENFRKIVVETKPIHESDLPEDVTAAFKGKKDVPGELFLIKALPKLELDDGRNAMKFAEDVAHFKTPAGEFYPSSDAVVYGIVLKTMLNDSAKLILISLLSVTFFVFLDFRSIRKTAIVMLSIITGVSWLLGLMYIFGVKFNFYNMIIIPAVMGMSIDNSIHIFHRYKELGKGSIPEVLSTTGVAAMLASLTNASGFFGLLFCVHRGLYSIGHLAVIGVATCFFSTLIFLPVLLQFLERFQKDNNTSVLPN